MTMEKRLAGLETELAEKWADAIFGTYPKETQQVWKNNKDRFSNPVGKAIRQATVELVDHLMTWEDASAIADSLNELIKVRAVQSFTPSQAIGFVFLFKKILRDEFFKALQAEGKLEDLLRFEAKLDNLAMMSFDIYSKSREQLFAMRVDEVKRSQRTLLRRAGMIADVTDLESEE